VLPRVSEGAGAIECPVVRLRWSPKDRALVERARSAASLNAGRFTIIDAEVTPPASAASIIPMLTPREIP
jgi:hypothetical protein